MLFPSPGGTPCIQMSCKQDIESIASEAGSEERGQRMGGGSGGWNKNKCEGYTEGERDGKKNERYRKKRKNDRTAVVKVKGTMIKRR